MGITFGVGLANEPDRVTLPGGGSLSAHADSEGVVLSIHGRPDLVKEIRLAVDHTIAPAAAPRLLLIDAWGQGVVILEDIYSSRPGGLSFCQSGEERFLRIIRLHNTAKETLRVKLASCIESRALDDPGLQWNAGERRLSIHWLPVEGHRSSAEYEVAADGGVRLLHEL